MNLKEAKSHGDYPNNFNVKFSLSPSSGDPLVIVAVNTLIVGRLDTLHATSTIPLIQLLDPTNIDTDILDLHIAVIALTTVSTYRISAILLPTSQPRTIKLGGTVRGQINASHNNTIDFDYYTFECNSTNYCSIIVSPIDRPERIDSMNYIALDSTFHICMQFNNTLIRFV